MHYLAELALRVATIYAGIAGGFLLKKVPKINKEERLSNILTFIGINILTPILLIIVMLGISNFGELKWWYIAIFAFLASVVSYFVDWLLLRRANCSPAEKGAELSAVAFMNSLFYPFPIIIGLVGTSGLLAASIFLIVNIVLRNTFGVIVGLHYGSHQHQSNLKIIKGVLLFPPTIPMVGGLIIRFAAGRPLLNNDNVALGVFRDFSMILMLSIVGLKFNFPTRNEWKNVPIMRTVASRFGSAAIVTIPIFFLSLPHSALVALFIQSLSPPAVNNTAYANYFNLDGQLTSRLIAVLTLIALLILPIEVFILLKL